MERMEIFSNCGYQAPWAQAVSGWGIMMVCVGMEGFVYFSSTENILCVFVVVVIVEFGWF